MYSPPRVVEEESDLNEAHNKSKQSRYLCVSTTMGISTYLTCKRVSIALERIMSLNSNVQKSSALQRNKNDSLSINVVLVQD